MLNNPNISIRSWHRIPHKLIIERKLQCIWNGVVKLLNECIIYPVVKIQNIAHSLYATTQNSQPALQAKTLNCFRYWLAFWQQRHLEPRKVAVQITLDRWQQHVETTWRIYTPELTSESLHHFTSPFARTKHIQKLEWPTPVRLPISQMNVIT